MARDLTQNQKDELGGETVRTTILIELDDAESTVLRLATADLTIGGEPYEGKLKPTSALRMSLIKKADKVSFEISNIDLLLGQDLIEDDAFFENAFAEFGAWHSGDGGWHDEKISGEIVSSQVDGDAVHCKFVSDVEAAVYNGVSIASEFTGLPPLRTNNFGDFNDLKNFPEEFDRIGSGKIDLFMDDFRYGRHYLPFEEFGAY